jgi:hypothetical protein
VRNLHLHAYTQVIHSPNLVVCFGIRAAHPFVLQHREAGDDRHGAESDLADARQLLEGELAAGAAAGAVQGGRARRAVEGERVCRLPEEGAADHGGGPEQGGRVRLSFFFYMPGFAMGLQAYICVLCVIMGC